MVATEAAAEPAGQRPGPGEDGGDVRRAAALGDLQLQVVDLADELAVPVDQLAVQQVQGRVVHPPGHGVSPLPW